jgi:CDP-paratose 2-epimerase
VIIDNLSRNGSKHNLEWLKERYKLSFEHVDVRDANKVNDIIRRYKPRVLLHLAGQVAVTTSIADPRGDFEVNALGSINVLEAVRVVSPETLFINASTNKVYGNMEDVSIDETESRYIYKDDYQGVDVMRPVDFYSPYGCSKGAADLYTVDYQRIYGLRTVTLRQSCIYGPRQCGMEDQGWVAWFAIAAILNRPITIFGNGKQVRDLLYIDDLLAAYDAVIANADDVSGRIFNIGGGMERTISVNELVRFLEATLGNKMSISYQASRPGDQRIFVCDIRHAASVLSWRPKTSVNDGLRSLVQWIAAHKSLFQRAS